MTDGPAFSLVIATYGEATHLGRCLDSLAAQSCQDYEIIIVDQNPDDRISTVLDRCRTRPRIRRLSCAKGLSRARNIGLRHARGRLVGFPDDDCWYPPDLLERLARRFAERHDLHGLSGPCVSPEGWFLGRKPWLRPCRVTRNNLWTCGSSASMFVRRSVFDAIGGFDEDLGLGAPTPFQSGEETDLQLRALAAGFGLFYDPALAIFHPVDPFRADAAAITRARLYGAGMGRVLRKHGTGPWPLTCHMLRPLLGAASAALTGRPDLARLRWARAAGRLSGWRVDADSSRQSSDATHATVPSKDIGASLAFAELVPPSARGEGGGLIEPAGSTGELA